MVNISKFIKIMLLLRIEYLLSFYCLLSELHMYLSVHFASQLVTYQFLSYCIVFAQRLISITQE